MEQQLVTLLVRLVVAASLASILSRSNRFLGLLLRDDRTLVERLMLSAGIAAFCAAGSTVRVLVHGYGAVDLSLEGSLVAGILGGCVAGLTTGVLTALPAFFIGGEYLAMPVFAAVGVLGGLVRDLGSHPEEIWRFSPFFDLSLYRLVRYPTARGRSAYHLLILLTIVLAESVRFVAIRQFGPKLLFSVLAPDRPLTIGLLYLTTIFTVSIPIKIWNSARNERLLDTKERLLIQSRLSALSSQINPHFLFNTLNTVGSLIRTNPEKARQVVYKLSSILRRLLRQQESLTPLREELSFIDDYLAIEMVRFGDKLRFVKAVDPATLDCQVPAMMLQPLIENSIKHGLADKIEGGSVRLETSLEGGRLHVAVEDDGVGIEEDRLGRLFESGIGVSNVNERLKVLYGDAYHMRVRSQPGQGTRTEIELPAPAPPAAPLS
jgi:two-component system LytT family sensor kinase